MGAYGEQTLVNIYGVEPECNLKVRTCIVRALALSNVNNASIDFVIEMLFKAAKDKKVEIRKAAITSLDILRKKNQHSIGGSDTPGWLWVIASSLHANAITAHVFYDLHGLGFCTMLILLRSCRMAINASRTGDDELACV